MYFRKKTKKIFRNISLGLLGIGAIGAVGFGTSKLVDYAKNDLKTIHPTFEVGCLGRDGEYVSNELSLYTKDSFRCDGLQAKLDFDSDISYQFFYYDDLGNFTDKTETYTKGESFTPLGTYARCVITPLHDEDEKISLKERITYPSQLDIKVSKKQTISTYMLGGRMLITANDSAKLVFKTNDLYDHENDEWSNNSKTSCTSKQLLNVNGYKSVSFNGTFSDHNVFTVWQFKLVDGQLVFIQCNSNLSEPLNFNNETDFVLLGCYSQSNSAVPYDYTSHDLLIMPTCFKLSK